MGCSCKYVINIGLPATVTPFSATLIDHIYTSPLDKSLFSDVAVADISDHNPKFCVIPLDKSKLKVTKEIFVRDMRNFDWADFAIKLKKAINEYIKPSRSIN